jgi:acyl-coenzyme A synthetase/AMP-(fatty) acid ligase
MGSWCKVDLLSQPERANQADRCADNIDIIACGTGTERVNDLMLDTIAFHARRTPARLALIDPVAGDFSYGETHRLVVALADKLLREIPDLRDLQSVAVACSDVRWHLLLTFALEALGVSVMAFVEPPDPGLRAALRHFPLVVGETGPAVSTQRYFRVSNSWFDSVMAEPRNARFESRTWKPNDVVAILTTSGSTGEAKCIPLHREAYDLREQNRVWQYGLSAESRYLVAMPISVSIVGMVARATLRCGGSLRFWRSGNPLIADPWITHTTLLPSHVQSILASTPADYRPTLPVKIFATGAPLSLALRDRAVARLGASVTNSYGTNETGTAIWFAADGTGEVLPGVDVEIVDQGLAAVPKGVAGLMRLRSREMARGYLDPELTSQRFVNGWYLSDDVAVMQTPRQVMLQGRSDTMINIGGTKVSPDEIEGVLFESHVARELAVCALPGSDGIDELYVLVADASMTDDALIKAVTGVLGPNFGHVRIARVASIPRNAGGKVQRHRLRELLANRAPSNT